MTTQPDIIRNEGGQKVIRLIRPSVVVLCGPAACGKSTFAAKHFRPTQITSSDHARALVCDDEKDQRFQTQAFALLHFLIEQRLGINRLCVVDSTALTLPARKGLLDLARRHQVGCVVLLLDVPLEACVERDAKRERAVGRPVIERHYQMFEQAKATIKQEGFDQVIELRDDELEKVQFEVLFRPVPRPAAAPAPPEAHAPRRTPGVSPTASNYRGRPGNARPPAPRGPLPPRPAAPSADAARAPQPAAPTAPAPPAAPPPTPPEGPPKAEG